LRCRRCWHARMHGMAERSTASGWCSLSTSQRVYPAAARACVPALYVLAALSAVILRAGAWDVARHRWRAEPQCSSAQGAPGEAAAAHAHAAGGRGRAQRGPAAGAATGAATLDLLRDLAALSGQMLADAREDANAFAQGAAGRPPPARP